MNFRLLFMTLAIGLVTACRPPQPAPSAPATEPITTNITTRNVTMPTSTPKRFVIGTPQHTYPLLEELEVSQRIANPQIKIVRGMDGTITLLLPLKPEEAIWGFGQRFDTFNLRGKELESWTTDGWNASDTSYYAVPFFISSRGYGLFINHPGRIRFDVGADNPELMTIRIPDQSVELIAFEGTPAEISRRYTELIGRPRPVPQWIYRPWVSRNSYLGAYEINRITDRMRSLGMPVGVAVLEAWAEQLHNFRFTTHRYPDTAAWIKQLNDQGVHIVCWITSSVWTSSDAYRQAKERGYLVLNDDGSEHVVRWLENGRKIDFRKPEARAWWRDFQKHVIAQGVEGFKTDGGEHMPDPIFHNQHAYYYQEASLEAFRDLNRTGITFARSASPINARLSTFWAGDQLADWRGLAMVVRGGLSTALCGFPYWGHDIGGYSGTPTKELYVRWMQFGAFSPIMQFHGVGPREPWHFDEETLEIARFYFQLREKLHTRIVAWGEEARTNGTPIIRPLIWMYPNDSKAHNIDNQYFFGPDLLVAPITDPLDERGIYLPEGGWVDAWTGEAYAGPQTLLYHAPLTRIPVFVRGEAYEHYREFFAGEPSKPVEPVSVILSGPKNDWGLVPALRYWGERSDPESIYYEIRNNSDTTATMSVQLRAPTACDVEPPGRVNLRLEPGEVQRVAYHVKPRQTTSPTTHRISLEVVQDNQLLPSPQVDLVIPPRWRVLGLLEGGVGSEQSLDGQPVQEERSYAGKNGKEIRWTDVPASLIEVDGQVNLSSLIGADGWSTYYLATDLVSDRVRETTIRAGFGDSMTVWLNGKEVTSVIGHRNPERDEDVFSIRLNPGSNRLLIRSSRDLSPPIFYLRNN